MSTDVETKEEDVTHYKLILVGDDGDGVGKQALLKGLLRWGHTAYVLQVMYNLNDFGNEVVPFRFYHHHECE